MPSLNYPLRSSKLTVYGKRYDFLYPDNKLLQTYQDYTVKREGEKFSKSHKRSPDGKYREGDGFLINKRDAVLTYSPVTVYRPGYNRRYYVGGFNMSAPTVELLSFTTEKLQADAYSYGAAAYQKLKPTLPDFRPIEDVFEMSAMLPEIKGKVKDMKFRVQAHDHWDVMSKLGQYHLAIQFGLLPLIGTVKGFIKALKTKDKVMQQLLRDEGKGVRRSGTLAKSGAPRDNAATTRVLHGSPSNPYMQPVLVTQSYGGAAAYTDTTAWENDRIWCVGKSKYWLPPGPPEVRKQIMLRRIMGTQFPTPSDLYNLMPWSWLLDYFTTTGSLLEVLSGDGIADRVVFDYAYIMRTIERGKVTRGTQSVVVGPSGPNYASVSSTKQWTTVIKYRTPASPFGFGLKVTDLSDHQLGILGALGLSRI